MEPVHSLPWYFGVVAFSIWAAAGVGIVVITRRRIRARAERRRYRQRPRRPAVLPDDRSLGTGKDVEPYHR